MCYGAVQRSRARPWVCYLGYGHRVFDVSIVYGWRRRSWAKACALLDDASSAFLASRSIYRAVWIVVVRPSNERARDHHVIDTYPYIINVPKSACVKSYE